VSDATEAWLEDVEEESADKLVGRDGLIPDGIVVLAVLVCEGDGAVIDTDDALVTDGDAIGIASQVLEDGVGASLRRLCEDNPGMATGLGEHGLRIFGCEVVREGDVASTQESRQLFEEASFEDLRQGFDGEDEAFLEWDPALMVSREHPPGDEAMNVWMAVELLVPGMENRGDAEYAAALGCEGLERIHGRGEQRTVCGLRVAPNQG